MRGIRIGVVGVGNIGSMHSKNIYSGKINGLCLVAVCDTDSSRLDWARSNLDGVSCFEHHTEMIQSGELDAVLIATPHFSHCDIAVCAFENGLHVLCEKPAGVYTHQVKNMNRAAQKAGTVFSIMFNQRTNPVYRAVRDIVRNGRLGTPIRMVWIATNWFRDQAYYDSGSWRATWAGEGGGVLLNQAVHQIDVWQWIYGMPSVITAHCGFGRHHVIEVEDDVTIYAEYDGGHNAVFITSTGDFPGTNRLEITGAKAKLVAENGGVTLWISNADKSEHEKISIPIADAANGHIAILQNFTNSILDGEPLIAPGEEGLHSLCICNAAYLSAWEKKAINLPVDTEKFIGHLQRCIDQSTFRKTESVPLLLEQNHKRWSVNW
jgi:predicted dehydrogenase